MEHQVTYKCGHIITKKLYSIQEDTERYIEWIKQYKLCSQCANEVELYNQIYSRKEE